MTSDPTIRTGAQLMRTKLNRPRILRRTVERPRLISQLDQYSKRLVTLVVAPAGYGKTTTVSQWLDTLDQQRTTWGWVSIDQYDNDLYILIDYMIAAIQLTRPDFGEATRLLLGAIQDVPPHHLADSLVQELLDVTEEFVLVLDDVHLLEDSSVFEFMERLLAYMPHNIHLVLIGRSRPNLPLVRLRLHGQLGELTTSDLAFRPDESAAMLSLISGHPVADDVAAIFDKQTEGWAAGLQLGGLALRVRDVRELTAELQTSAPGVVTDYLINEVIALVPDDMRHFMLRTAVVDQLGASLCAHLVHDLGDEKDRYAAAKTMLTRIHDAQLFLLSLDDRNHWYRYHHLLQETLLQLAEATYGPEWVAESHRRAAEWYLQTGQITEAIHHAKEAGDDVGAARLVETHYHAALDAEDKPLLNRWLRLVPESAMDRPGILIVRAWSEHLMFHVAAAAALARQAEAALVSHADGLSSEEVASLRADITVLVAQADYFSARPVTGEDALAMAERVPANHLFCKGLAVLFAILILQREDRLAEALALANDFHQQTPTPHAGSLRVMLGQCTALLFTGNLSALRETSQTYEHMARQTDSQVSVGWAHLLQGYVAYMRNDLATAETFFSKVIHFPQLRQGKSISDAYSGLCLSKLAAGDIVEARRIYRQYLDALMESQNYPFLSVAHAIGELIELASRGEDTATTRTAEPALASDSPILQMSLFSHPALVQARRCLAHGDKQSLQDALNMLDGVESLVRTQNEQYRLMEIMTLRALVLEGLGQTDEAISAMSAALKQGQRETFIRTIVDCGPGVVRLLERIRSSGAYVAYIDRLLSALRTVPAKDESGQQPVTEWFDLTNREIDVLEGLQRRMSNKEIAAELYLSPLTVKRHAQNLYRKLGASNRREAVDIARRNGLLV